MTLGTTDVNNTKARIRNLRATLCLEWTAAPGSRIRLPDVQVERRVHEAFPAITLQHWA